MASKIQSHNFYVAITPYKVEDSSADEFNMLNVRTAYDDRRKYFYVDLHAGWDTGWGGFGCILMGADDPLTAPKYVKVKDAPKNSQKTINEIGASLEQAKDAIAWLFDHREWAKLYLAVGNIARNGYTEYYRKQMEELINNNKPNKEDENMRLNINSNSETKNVQTAAQVNNNSNDAVMHEVDVIGLMNGLKKNGEAKLSDYATPVVPDAAPVEDAHAEEIESISVGEVTVDSIMPVMQPVEGSEYAVESDGTTATFESVAPNIDSEEKPAVTMPLGDHGTLVIGGVPKSGGQGKSGGQVLDRSGRANQATCPPDSPKVTLKRKVQDSVPQASGAYRVVLVPSKDGSGQWPKLYGFQSEDAAEKMIKRMAKSIRNSWDRDEDGEKRFYIKGGKKYCDVFQELCNALNAGDKAAIDKACKRTVAIYDGAVADGKAESAAKKAEREVAKAATSYSDQDVADMLRKVMAGGDVPENIKKLLAA